MQNVQGIHVSISIGIHVGMATVLADTIPEGITAITALQLARKSLPQHIMASQNAWLALNPFLQFQPVKSTNNSIKQYELLGEKKDEIYNVLRSMNHGSAFVGRDNDLQNCLSSLNHVTHSTLYISGEAGVGKSRFVMELKKAHRVLDYQSSQCLPERSKESLFPIFELISNRYVLDDLPGSEKAEKLKELLVNFEGNKISSWYVLCSWMGLDVDGIDEAILLPVEIQKTTIFSVLAHLLFKPQSDEKNCIIIEDLHWADSMSLEFMGYLIRHPEFPMADLRCIITSRTNDSPLTFSENVLAVPLERLDHDASYMMIAKSLDATTISDSLATTLIHRTDGIPLFIEEMVNMLKAEDLLVRVNGIVDFRHEAISETIPLTLHSLLQQKLDRLGAYKSIIQLAAVVGREFSEQELEVLVPTLSNALYEELSALVDNELIVEHRQTTGLHYYFKHALIRDAAYASIPEKQRLEMHLHIAETFEALFLNRMSQSDIARHFSLGKNDHKASIYWLQSAELAFKQGNSLQSIEYYDAAIESNSQLEQTQSVISKEIEMRSAMGIALSLTEGYASEAVISNQDKMINSTKKLDSVKNTYMQIWQRCVSYVVQANYPAADRLSEELMVMSSIDNKDGLIFSSTLMKMAVLWQTGNFIGANQLADDVLDQYEYDKHNKLSAQFSYDPGIAIMIVKAMVEWSLGHAESAAFWQKKALMLSRQSNDPSNLVHTLTRYYQIEVYAKNIPMVEKYAHEALELAERHDYMLWIVCAKITLAWAKCMKGESLKDAFEDMESAYQTMIHTGTRAIVPYYLTLIAEAYQVNGHYDVALIKIDQAIDMANKQQDRLYLVETYRVKLAILAKADECADFINITENIYREIDALVKEQQCFGFYENVEKLYL